MHIARNIPGVQIVNADSRQMYRGMSIGTAKPSSCELNAYPHHMIDVADPDVLLSAGWYAREAMKIIESTLDNGLIPLVVGGSALYIMSLAGLLDPLPERNDALRLSLNAVEDAVPGSLHRLLQGLDLQESERTGEADRVRLIRAIEIGLISGSKASALKNGGRPDGRFRFVFIEVDNKTLRHRIRSRTAEMLEAGLLDEVKELLEKGFSRDPVLGSTIGYAELLDHLEGKCSLEEARERIEINTWHYARRQRNLFRRLPGVVSVSSNPMQLEAALFGERRAGG